MVYLPDHFAQPDQDILHACIRHNPLAALVTNGEGGLVANHIPFVLEAREDGPGVLIGHVARYNDLWREGFHEDESLIIFQAADGYISPNWYPTKAETHEVVPTWNYVVVHAYGPLIVHDDAKWVRGAAGRLTRQMESLQPRPWKMADAPSGYLKGMLENIVGIEIPLTRVVGKWKASQNRSQADRDGAIAGLRRSDTAGDTDMATVMSSADTHSRR